MAIKFPNRTGEIGTYTAGVVTLSGQALPGMRNFAAALGADRIADGDTVGLAIRAISDASQWQVWQAEYSDAGTLSMAMMEDASTSPLTTDALVEATACVTDWQLRNMGYAEPDIAWGPDYWTEQTPGDLEWMPMDASWRVIANSTNGWLAPPASFAALRPATVSVDVWVPPGADLEDAATMAGFVILFTGGDGNAEVYAGETVAHGWNTVTGTITGQTGDFTSLGLFSAYDDRADYRHRNFVATA